MINVIRGELNFQTSNFLSMFVCNTFLNWFYYRLNCMTSCNKAYFPSMLCEEVTDVKIVMHGNTYDRFYRFPNPEFVRENELSKEHYIKSHEDALCSIGYEIDEKNPDRVSECSTKATCAVNADCTNPWESCGTIDEGATKVCVLSRYCGLGG